MTYLERLKAKKTFVPLESCTVKTDKSQLQTSKKLSQPYGDALTKLTEPLFDSFGGTKSKGSQSFFSDSAKVKAFVELPRQEAEYRAFRLTWPSGSCTMTGDPTTVEEALEHAQMVFGDQCEAAPIEASKEARHG